MNMTLSMPTTIRTKIIRIRIAPEGIKRNEKHEENWRQRIERNHLPLIRENVVYPLPKTANPSHGAKTFDDGTFVLAVYPQTTTFYKAKVVRSASRIPPSGDYGEVFVRVRGRRRRRGRGTIQARRRVSEKPCNAKSFFSSVVPSRFSRSFLFSSSNRQCSSSLSRSSLLLFFVLDDVNVKFVIQSLVSSKQKKRGTHEKKN